MIRSLYTEAVLTIYEGTLRALESDGDLRWIGFQIDSLKNTIDDGIKKGKFNFEDAALLMKLLGKFTKLEELELERIKSLAENLVDEQGPDRE